MVFEFELTSTDMALYGWIVALTSFCWVHLFHKVKNKFLAILFPILLFYLNTHLPEYYTLSGNDYLVANTVFILLYYFINVKNKSVNALIHVLLGAVLPFGLSLFIIKTNIYVDALLSWKPLPINNPVARQYHAELIARILISLYILLRKLHFKLKKKEISLQNESFIFLVLFFSVTMISIIIIIIENLLSPFTDLCLLAIGLLLLFAYDYSKKLKKEKQTLELETELNKNKAIYHHYLDEIDKFAHLKHKILAILRTNETLNDNTEVFNQINALITPVIQYYSNNRVLNRILVEKNLTFQKLGIHTSIRINDDLNFLKDTELVFLFSLILEKLINLKELKDLSLSVKRKTEDLYMISYIIESNQNINFIDLWNSPICKELEEKYEMTYSHIVENHTIYLNIYLIHPGGILND